MTIDLEALCKGSETVRDLHAMRETVWENPRLTPCKEAMAGISLTGADIDDAQARLARFAPFIMKCFPETVPQGGLIESPLTPIPHLQALLNRDFEAGIPGQLYLKQDSHLAIAGSVKARGGIYEVLKHSEDLAVEHGLLHAGDSYEVFGSLEFHSFFSQYAIHVGSTGNLGMSIGIISSVLGYHVTVHMSADAKQWKKDLLRSRGVNVIEYASDYSNAVQEGRKLAATDPYSYFVDDENSVSLFLGYAVAARRLAAQLKAQSIAVDADHPLLVTIPCGVGGAPGGITFGLKEVFGDDVYCFFAEPVQAPCMTLGMSTGLHDEVSVQDIGLTGLTAADGLAVGRPSKFVGKTVSQMVAGIITIQDSKLFDYMRGLLQTENIFIEPSACAGFHGPVKLRTMEHFLQANGLTPERLQASTSIVWATGGSLIPEAERKIYCNTY